MFTQLSPNIQALVLAFAGFASFTVADTGAKFLTDYYSVFQIIGFNAVAIAVVCIALARFLGGFKRSFQTTKLKFHIGRGLSNTILLVFIIAGLAKLDLPTFYTIIFCTPFVISIMALIFFKEPISKHGLIAIIIGFIGVLIVMRPGFEAFNIWLLLPLCATFFISTLSLLAKPLGNDETILSLALYPTISNLILVAIPTFTFLDIPSINHWLIFLIIGIFSTAGLIFTAQAYRKANASIVSPAQYSQILWGIGFGYFIFNDMPDTITLLGAAVIISSGLYLVYSERKSGT